MFLQKTHLFATEAQIAGAIAEAGHKLRSAAVQGVDCHSGHEVFDHSDNLNEILDYSNLMVNNLFICVKSNCRPWPLPPSE